MENEISEECLRSAAEWWAKVLTNAKMDNGDNSMSGGIAAAMALSLRNPVNESQVETFISEFIKFYGDKAKEFRGSRIFITCDYGPDMNLLKIMNIARISGHNAPWKTDMSIKDNIVKVSYGYCAEWVQVYPIEQPQT